MIENEQNKIDVPLGMTDISRLWFNGVSLRTATPTGFLKIDPPLRGHVTHSRTVVKMGSLMKRLKEADT